MNILPGDLLFVWGHGFFPEIIEGVTHGPSHVAIIKDENTIIEAQAGTLVGERDLSFYLKGNDHMEVWGDPVLVDHQRQRMLEYVKTLYGIPYDYLLIPLEFLHFEFGMKLSWYHENKHVICSTFINDAAQNVGAHWSKVTNPAPVDFLNGGVLTKKLVLNKEEVS